MVDLDCYMPFRVQLGLSRHWEHMTSEIAALNRMRHCDKLLSAMHQKSCTLMHLLQVDFEAVLEHDTYLMLHVAFATAVHESSMQSVITLLWHRLKAIL